VEDVEDVERVCLVGNDGDGRGGDITGAKRRAEDEEDEDGRILLVDMAEDTRGRSSSNIKSRR